VDTTEINRDYLTGLFAFVEEDKDEDGNRRMLDLVFHAMMHGSLNTKTNLGFTWPLLIGLNRKAAEQASSAEMREHLFVAISTRLSWLHSRHYFTQDTALRVLKADATKTQTGQGRYKYTTKKNGDGELRNLWSLVDHQRKWREFASTLQQRTAGDPSYNWAALESGTWLAVPAIVVSLLFKSGILGRRCWTRFPMITFAITR
jgi:hypothetical protein